MANYQELFQSHVEGQLLHDIRKGTHAGFLGSDKFKEEMQTLTGESFSPRKRGPGKN